MRVGTVVVCSLTATGLILLLMKKPLLRIAVLDKAIINFCVGYELSAILALMNAFTQRDLLSPFLYDDCRQ